MGDSNTSQLNSFEQLEAWQKTQDLSVAIYKLTKKFPPDEKFGLTNQIRRASTSISANIAEGFGRTSIKEKLNFYSIARGSLLEVKSFLYLSEKLEYLENEQLSQALEDIVVCQKLINGLLRSTRKNLDV